MELHLILLTSVCLELATELFFFVVVGEEDLAVLVEAADQTFYGVRRISH